MTTAQIHYTKLYKCIYRLHLYTSDILQIDLSARAYIHPIDNQTNFNIAWGQPTDDLTQ